MAKNSRPDQGLGHSEVYISPGIDDAVAIFTVRSACKAES